METKYPGQILLSSVYPLVGRKENWDAKEKEGKVKSAYEEPSGPSGWCLSPVHMYSMKQLVFHIK